MIRRPPRSTRTDTLLPYTTLVRPVADLAIFPLLITTADNCLLTPETIAEIDREATRLGAEAGVALARREDVLAVHPEGQRRFYEFSDVAVSNCNAYWIGHRGALRAAEAFRGGGQFVKKPIRVMQAFGHVKARKSVVWGKSVSVRVDVGGRGISK